MLTPSDVVPQESPWSTETASDSLAVAGHGRTPSIHSGSDLASELTNLTSYINTVLSQLLAQCQVNNRVLAGSSKGRADNGFGVIVAAVQIILMVTPEDLDGSKFQAHHSNTTLLLPPLVPLLEATPPPPQSPPSPSS